MLLKINPRSSLIYFMLFTIRSIRSICLAFVVVIARFKPRTRSLGCDYRTFMHFVLILSCCCNRDLKPKAHNALENINA